MFDQLDVVVVANRRRKPIITDYLMNVPHRVNWTEDYEYPGDDTLSPEMRLRLRSITNHVGPYRCFRGHQEAIRLSEKPYVLVFEDDALPAIEVLALHDALPPEARDWKATVARLLPVLDEFEVVSLHGRGVLPESRPVWRAGVELLLPAREGNAVKWCLGSLAYLVKRSVAGAKLLDQQYVGLPMDLLLANNFTFAVIKNSPFEHDRKFGSLIELS